MINVNLVYLSIQIGDAKKGVEKGIRLNSGAVPAAVNSVEFLHIQPLPQ